MRASYKVALRIAKAQKPYTVGETLVIVCIIDVCQEMLGEVAHKMYPKFQCKALLLHVAFTIWQKI